MKTKILIEYLQKADPSGELECLIAGNVDIFSIHTAPMYYDGYGEILVRDETCPYYNIRGGKVTTQGTKVTINALSLEDAVFEAIDTEEDDFPIEVDFTYADNGQHKREFLEQVEKWRQEAIKIKKEVREQYET